MDSILTPAIRPRKTMKTLTHIGLDTPAAILTWWSAQYCGGKKKGK